MKKSLKKAVSFFLTLLLLFSFSSVIFANAADAPEINGSNWMSAVDGNVPITAINIPGTHDSATTYCTFSLFSQTQFMTIEAQLYAGVRYLDMRLEYRDGEFYSVHGISDCRVSDSIFSEKLTAAHTIDVCKRFLDKNPGETVLFLLKEENSSEGYNFFESFYSRYIQGDEESWYLENKTPSLNEAKGKIVLLRNPGVSSEKFNNSNSGINFSRYPYIGGTEVIDFRKCDISSLEGSSGTYSYMLVQDSYKLAPKEKWESMSAFWEQGLDKADYNINMANCTGGLPFPIFTACKVNAELSEYDFSADGYYGIVGLDFATKELCKKIFMSNTFSAEPNEPSETPASAIPSFLVTLKNTIKITFFELLSKIF